MIDPEQTPAGTIVCFGEVLLRLAAPPQQLLFQTMALEASFCGAEANVAVALAGLGHRCRLATALPDNAPGVAARHAVGAFGVEVAAPAVADGRMGLYYLQPGAMQRPSSIAYDRAGSAFARIDAQTFDWEKLLGGAAWLFVSGITAALGAGPLAALRAALAAAKSAGVRVAFDTNYRPALWRGREGEAAHTLRELSCEADLLFAGRRAVAMMTGGRFDHADGDEGFHAAAQAMFALSPRLSHMAATRRVIHSTDRQDLTALLADRTGMSTSGSVPLERIVDRVGTGDAYAAGILHGIHTNQTRDDTVRFASACAQWAHSVPGDFLRASVADIEGMLAGGGDVGR